tara:strand:- start:117 stop:356 length:240 start_codon:yes stop_codon:yes gene_type:complete
MISISKYIEFKVFLISLAFGLLFVYLYQPPTSVIYVYPTPNNINDLNIKDKAGNCFNFNAIEVVCPRDKTKIENIPVQN